MGNGSLEQGGEINIRFQAECSVPKFINQYNQAKDNSWKPERLTEEQPASRLTGSQWRELVPSGTPIWSDIA